ncbi:MAG: type III pantothenate kinase [Bacteroidota bacterium]
MFLALDIGNSSVKAGLFDGSELTGTFRLEADATASVPAYRYSLRSRLDGQTPAYIGLSSVVPGLTRTLTAALRQEFMVLPEVVSVDRALPFEIAYQTPHTLGLDRLAGAAGAWSRFSAQDRPLVVVDAGTAVNVEVVRLQDGRAIYEGGTISPGLRLGLSALKRGTAQLPEVPAKLPRRLIGQTTKKALQAGSVTTFVDGVAGLVRRLDDRLGGHAFIIATGGDAPLLTRHISRFDAHEPHLVLHGVRALLA